MDRAEIHPVASGIAGVFTARAPDLVDEPNEDSLGIFSIDEQSGVLALADGLGGRRGGSMASGLAVKKLEEAIDRGPTEERSLRACVIDGFENANQAVIDTGLGAATTLTAIEIVGETIRPYHVGDSMALVVGQRGRLKLQTVSHSPVGYAVESGVLDEQEAMNHESRHLVSNVVGSSEMHIAVGAPIVLGRRDTVILASDGLSDNLHTEEIIELIRVGKLEDVLGRLAREARTRMTDPSPDKPSKPDDLSFIVYRRAV